MAEGQKVILVVDDEPDARDFFITVLEDNGYATVSARDGNEALQRLEEGLPDLVTLAARRLWRAFFEQKNPKLHAPDPWGAALVLAILEIDGGQPSIASIARSVRSKPSSVRTVLSRLRDFLSSLDPEMRQRAFAAYSNPRLDGAPSTQHSNERSADVVPFPNR